MHTRGCPITRLPKGPRSMLAICLLCLASLPNCGYARCRHAYLYVMAVLLMAAMRAAGRVIWLLTAPTPLRPDANNEGKYTDVMCSPVKHIHPYRHRHPAPRIPGGHGALWCVHKCRRVCVCVCV